MTRYQQVSPLPVTARLLSPASPGLATVGRHPPRRHDPRTRARRPRPLVAAGDLPPRRAHGPGRLRGHRLQGGGVPVLLQPGAGGDAHQHREYDLLRAEPRPCRGDRAGKQHQGGRDPGQAAGAGRLDRGSTQ